MHIGVVIPARDEEDLIARCLRSVLLARDASGVEVSVTIAADGCLDRTAAIARCFDGVHVLELESSNVGSTRAAGARHALSLGAHWLACTDADSIVPLNWLSEQAALARDGVDVMVGTVRPEFGDLSAEQVEAWTSSHRAGEPNGHIHAANLGMRATVYLAAGGYRELPEHEDVDLVERMHGTLRATDRCEVITSGRRFGRTPGGYARYLRDDLVRAPRLA